MLKSLIIPKKDKNMMQKMLPNSGIIEFCINSDSKLNFKKCGDKWGFPSGLTFTAIAHISVANLYLR